MSQGLKQLRVLLLPPGWDASPLQGYPQQYVAGTHSIHLGEETLWGKGSCLRKQHDGRYWASNHQPSDLKSSMVTTTPPHPYNIKKRTHLSPLEYCPSKGIMMK